MSDWLLALVILSGFMVARGFVMLYLVAQTARMHRLLVRYWNGEVDYSEINRRKSYIIRLLKAGHASDAMVPFVQPVGFGQFTHGHVRVFDNLANRREDVVGLLSGKLDEARGYYLDEVRRSFIPIFWPSVIAHLPADVLVFVGVPPSSVGTRLATAAGWIVTVAGIVLGFVKLFAG